MHVSHAVSALMSLKLRLHVWGNTCLNLLSVFQWRERGREDGGSQIYHGLHLQSVRGRIQSAGERSSFFFFLSGHCVIDARDVWDSWDVELHRLNDNWAFFEEILRWSRGCWLNAKRSLECVCDIFRVMVILLHRYHSNVFACIFLVPLVESLCRWCNVTADKQPVAASFLHLFLSLHPIPLLLSSSFLPHYQPISSLLFAQPPSAIWQPPKPADVLSLSSIKI